MPELVWITDPHLEFASEDRIARLGELVRQLQPAGVLITGDISPCETFTAYLCKLAESWGRELPLYFVLGNHDAYGESLEEVGVEAWRISTHLREAQELESAGVVKLSEKTALIGAGGWYDGRNGDYERSNVQLADFTAIAEFRGLDKSQRKRLMEELTDSAAEGLQASLEDALREGYQRIICATHVPPYHGAGWYKGQLSDDDFAPFFTNKAVGDVLSEAMSRYPDRELLVYCGHTHSEGYYQPLPNVHVYTGGAEYGNPQITGLIEIL